MTLPELRLLMAATGKVDIFVMQSCLMQMVEVAYQIKDYVDVIVGSSEIMWSVGYDLKGLLDILNAEPGITSENLGARLADGYVQRVQDYKLPGAHASVLVTSQLPTFIGKLNAWVEAVMALKNREILVPGILETVRFDIFGITVADATQTALAEQISMSADLYDFVNIVNENLPQNKPESLLAHKRGIELMEFTTNHMVYKYAYTGKSHIGFDFSRAHGLSIHIPMVKIVGEPCDINAFVNQLFETNYWDLLFAKETEWGTFLNWLYGRN